MTTQDPAESEVMPGPDPQVMMAPEIVQHVQNAFQSMPPQAQDAVDHAHGLVAGKPIQPSGGGDSPFAGISLPNPPASQTTSVTPQASGPVAPAPNATPAGAGSSIKPQPPIAPPPTAAQSELQRLQTTGSGTSQIHNPFLKTLGVIGDVVGSGLFPGFAQYVPGTSAHHHMLVNNAEGQVADEAGEKAALDTSRLSNAKAAEEESLPDLHQAKSDLEATKVQNVRDVADAKQALAESEAERKKGESEAKIAAHLAQNGFKIDPETKEIIPLPYEEMSEPQQAIHDLKGSQAELADAKAELSKAQAANQPTLIELAKRRIDNANHTAATAERRLGLSQAQFEMRAHGTENGVPLPGSLITDDGKPVGTGFQQNVRPTGQERNKADMGISAREQLSDIKNIVKSRPDVFGPAAGRKTDFTVWVGSQDPDAQRFRAARTIAGDHLAGTFGGRSEPALAALDDAIGKFKDNPKAIIAGIDQIDKANQVFIKKGTPRTTGSDAAKGSGDGLIDVQLGDGRPGKIHPSQKDKFLKDNPGSKVVDHAK